MNKDFARGMIVSLALKSLPVRKKAPIAYLYNGVRLPALPEFDGYAHMVVHKIGDTFYMRAYENKPTTTLYKPIFDPAYDRLVADGEWNSAHMEESEAGDYWFTHSEPSDDSKGAVLAIAEIVWANFDVLNSDGTLYLAASDPIPIYNEPVNYLYNGVKLPKLPEWDREVYPYAHIFPGYSIFGSPSDYSLYPSDKPLRYGEVDGQFCIYYPAGAKTLTFRCSLTDGEFKTWESKAGATSSQNAPQTTIWTNHDVISDVDGSVYYNASEPVPVYE